MKLAILVLKLTIFVTYVVGYQDWFFTVRGKESIRGPFGRLTYGQDSLKPRQVPCMVHTS